MTLDLSPLLERRRTPLTTYRLQLHPGFGFREAAALADYLAALGVTDCYTSPVLKARPGSTHGYDITDHGRINPELGGEAGYDDFAAALRARDLGHLLDFAPNHMAADAGANPWWRDVLENGPASRYADFFDIVWNPKKPELKNKVLLPILGDQYGAVLERGELKLAFDGGRFSLLTPAGPLPIDPQQAPQILRHGLDRLARDLGSDPAAAEFLSILTALEKLPLRSDIQTGRPEERRRESEAARGRLEKLAAGSARVARHVEEALRFFNGVPGEPSSFDALHGLLESQGYRLSYWKAAADEINYRRFFDINDLAGLRMEREEVFEATHGLVLDLLASGKATGLRIDHPDGLYDPSRYFERLQAAFVRAWVRRRVRPGGELTSEEVAALEAWRADALRKDFKSAAARPLYVVAEKILSPGEEIDPHWAVDGSSGYEFLNDVNRVFADPAGSAALVRVYETFTGKRAPPETVAYASKKAITSTTMASELNVLADRLAGISESDRRTRDFTRQSLRRALGEIVACFPVYRTYVTGPRATAYDRAVIDEAVARARRRNPAMEPTIFEFIREHMLPKNPEAPDDAASRDEIRFAMKMQQYTAPVQAKGIEDTAFYRYHVLISNNEVGSELARFTETLGQFHAANRRRAEQMPRTLLATATHDTKRGEDARARIVALSEIPTEWAAEVERWSRANRRAKTELAGSPAPDANDEYFFYQVLLGAWDFDRGEARGTAPLLERLQAYLLKAGREAKLKTSWLAPNAEYEKATADFAAAALSNGAFLERFLPFARRVAELGALSSLSRTVLKAASPGVADFFQGTELWDLSLVDPDNRRPVDYRARREMLASLEPLLSGGPGAPAGLRALLEAWPDGRVKMFVTAKALRCRRGRRELFLKGSYAPLEVRGRWADRFVAFRRAHGGEQAIVVAPRLLAGPLWKKGAAGARALTHATSLVPPRGGFPPLVDVFTGTRLASGGSLRESLPVLPLGLFVGGTA
jgi:(1->4)-alpha-D-glucan 1-alpha-D-glucosylmutase